MRTIRTDEEFSRQLAELIAAQGISSLTVGEIAAQLHCSRRRLYAIAATKEELLLCVARRIFEEVTRQGHEAAKREKDAAKAIAAYLEVGAATSAQASVAFLNDLQATSEGRTLFDDFQSTRTDGLKYLVDKGVESGVFAEHNSHLVAEALLGASRQIRRPQFLAQTGMTLEQAFRELIALMLEGLRSRPMRRSPLSKQK